MTYSLCVLVLETTNSFDIFIPLMVAMQISRTFSKLIVDYTIFDRGLRIKNIPLLRETMPETTKSIKAYQIMAKNVITVPSLADMDNVKRCLTSTHNQFPVMNTAGYMVGLVNK